jgi:F0F1-type ATP synthase assembly protein I
VSSAHVFYLPVMILIGFFAGFFAGRRAAEADEAAARKRLERRARAREVGAAHSSDEES